jgi:hypothetical protein
MYDFENDTSFYTGKSLKLISESINNRRTIPVKNYRWRTSGLPRRVKTSWLYSTVLDEHTAPTTLKTETVFYVLSKIKTDGPFVLAEVAITGMTHMDIRS